jgi:hypothetical protein
VGESECNGGNFISGAVFIEVCFPAASAVKSDKEVRADSKEFVSEDQHPSLLISRINCVLVYSF